MRLAPIVLSGVPCQVGITEHLLVGVCRAEAEIGEVTREHPERPGRALIGRVKEERHPRPQSSLQSIAAHMSLFGGLGNPLEGSKQSTKSSSGVSRGTTHFQDNLGSEFSREGEEHEPEEYLRTMSVHF